MTTDTFLPGAVLLKQWLAERGLTAHRFAIENRLDPSELNKILRGKRGTVGVAFAVAIEDATRGYVLIRSWVPRKSEEQTT